MTSRKSKISRIQILSPKRGREMNDRNNTADTTNDPTNRNSNTPLGYSSNNNTKYSMRMNENTKKRRRKIRSRHKERSKSRVWRKGSIYKLLVRSQKNTTIKCVTFRILKEKTSNNMTTKQRSKMKSVERTTKTTSKITDERIYSLKNASRRLGIKL